MRIKKFEVLGLQGRDEPLLLDFNEDINIITGRNGSGKTSAMKLMWYMISGNISQALKEVDFKKATIQTSEYDVTVYRISKNTCRVEYQSEAKPITFNDIEDDDGDIIINAEDEADSIIQSHGSSVFFPTFRRIEGGFTLNDSIQHSFIRSNSDIEQSLITLSKRLSNESHAFISALSTIDVVSLLVRQYTDLSEEYNKSQQSNSLDVIKKIKSFKSEATGEDQLDAAKQLLDHIKVQIEQTENSREAIMRPLEAVREIVMKLFRHSGIKLGKHLNFGNAANAVNSDVLSAGEKQMLSFIAYNAFYKNAVIFIDEPELSLHVDWQRQLFSVLLNQQATNQFVIATHSPFIYSKYPDKELQIDPSRGDEE